MILWCVTALNRKEIPPKFDYARAGDILGITFASLPDIQEIPYRFGCSDVIYPGDFLLEARSKYTSSLYSGGCITYDPSELCYLGIVEINDKRIILFDAYIDGVKKELPHCWYYGYLIHGKDDEEEFFYLRGYQSPGVIKHDKSVVIRRKYENTLK